MSTKIMPLSGFPEWLPPQRMIEQSIVARLQRTFELYGFSPLETRAVEPLDQLLRKGETSKEVYVVRRLQGLDERGQASGERGQDPGEPEADEGGLGLHFDLTVPFARFVTENAGRLEFPFRRYQIQKAWRGEKPQVGRYREFLQADIDIVDRDTLGLHNEVEIPLVIGDALGGLPIPPVTIQVNNRKLCEGFYRGLGLSDPEAALRAIDKLDKIGPTGVSALLAATAGASDAQAKACLALAGICASDASFADAVSALGVRDPLLDEGLDELVRVVETARVHVPGLLVAQLKIARGLDYYTGTVYETIMHGYEKFGSICSGGRYDNLVSSGTGKFPGVGISIGVSRILGLLFGAGALAIPRNVPTCVLVALPDEQSRPACIGIAARLRSRGIATEVAPEPAKFGKQIRYADRRGIPFVWFPAARPGPDTGSVPVTGSAPVSGSVPVTGSAPVSGAVPVTSSGAGATDEVKDIRSGDQTPADADSWMPPLADLFPQVAAA